VRAFADGRVYTASQALALGLVDQVGYLEEAVAAAKSAARLTEAKVITYHRPRQYRATIYSSAETPGPAATFPDLARIVVSGPRFLYLWWP
jgi:protease-4